MFAKIDEDLFRLKTIIDSNAVIQKLQDSNDYVSIQQIIKHATDNDFPETKTMFKLKTNESQFFVIPS